MFWDLVEVTECPNVSMQAEPAVQLKTADSFSLMKCACAVSLNQACAVSLNKACAVSLNQACAVSLNQACAVSLNHATDG